MTRVVHLTDLHFGLHDPDLVGPLKEAVLSVAPDVILVSGDLTQRALRGQFAEAMAFLRGLAKPFLVVPGNHDVPVFNLFQRLFNPFGPYRDGAAADLGPVLKFGPLRIFGMNTANPYRWRGGIARIEQVDTICTALRDGPQGGTNIIVCHHPLEEPSGFVRGETRDAQTALARLTEAGADILLSGHLHHWSTGLGITGQARRAVFQMQTGTALCARAGESNHGFAVLDIGTNQLSAKPWIIDMPSLRFVPQTGLVVRKAGGEWCVDP